MDLLGRKSKALLELVVTKAEELQAQRDEAVQIALQQRTVNTELAAALASRSSLIVDYLDDIKRLKEDIRRLSVSVPVSRSVEHARPLHLSDEEAELQWQLENKLINKADYEAILSELDFQNTEIEIDPDYRPRPDLTY